MAEGRPHLVAVAEPSEPAPAQHRRRGRALPWLLAAVAVICAVGWGFAWHESGALARELASAKTALAEVTASLQAIEAQRAEVRSQLQALSGEANVLSQRLAELEALLATDPARATEKQPMRSEVDPSD